MPVKTRDASSNNPLYEDYLAGAPGRAPIDRWHHYFDVYHRHFQDYRGKKPTVIEIGVQRGGSLAMWQKYFGEGARLFGVDVDPACADRAPPGTKVLIGDQADKDFLRRVLDETGPPDIVIDDGGHTARQQINSFDVLYPATKIPGVYLVEDTCTSFWTGGYSDDPQKRNFVGQAFRAVISMHDWMGNFANFKTFSIPPDQRKTALPASEICRTTDSICFYESMVVFTRRNRPEPWRESR
jgi:hypothetical protein